MPPEAIRSGPPYPYNGHPDDVRIQGFQDVLRTAALSCTCKHAVQVAKKNATIDDRLALLVIGLSENGIFDLIFDDLADALSI